MQNNKRTVKKYSKNPNKVKSTSFNLNVLKMWRKGKNPVNKIEDNEPEKLNLPLKTEYAEVKQEKVTATLVRH